MGSFKNRMLSKQGKKLKLVTDFMLNKWVKKLMICF